MYNHIAIDCPSLIFASAWKLKNLNANEMQTGGIYGFFRKVRWLAEEFHSNKFLFCWDSKISERKSIYSGYKGKRKDRDEESEKIYQSIYRQMEQLRDELLPKAGFKNVFIQEGREADDLLAQLALYHEGLLIVTSDNDMLQLLDLCDMWNPGKNLLWTEQSFVDKYGIAPKEWADIKAIGGCDSDDVPGVKGVAELTAIKYLTGKLGDHTKAYQNIKDAEKLIARNLRLVELPFAGTQYMDIQKDELNLDAFEQICNDLWFDSFLGDEWFYWERLFEGKV